MDAKTRRAAQAITFAASVLFILWVGGIEFALRPVGLAYLVLWTVLAFATAVYRRPGAPSKYDRSQIAWRTVLGILGFAVILVLGPWEYTHLSGPIPRDGWVAWTGIALFAVGIAINTWAMATLRAMFTVRLGVQKGHRLVTSGPYRLVRHPAYFGFVLALPGMGLALGSVALLALTVAILAWIVSRIRVEEAMLVEQFGEEYRAYQRRTKRLVPMLY